MSKRPPLDTNLHRGWLRGVAFLCGRSHSEFMGKQKLGVMMFRLFGWLGAVGLCVTMLHDAACNVSTLLMFIFLNRN